MMTTQIKTLDMVPRQRTSSHVARRIGADKAATRLRNLDLRETGLRGGALMPSPKEFRRLPPQLHISRHHVSISMTFQGSAT